MDIYPTPSACHPSPNPSPGLLNAPFDILGGAYLEQSVRGSLDGAVYSVTANTVTIPADKGGGQVTWIRAVWLSTVVLRWAGFMADIDPAFAGDTTNHMVSSVNNIGATVITLDGTLPNGTQVQVYYSHRSGQRTVAGQSLGGWPQLHTYYSLNQTGIPVGTTAEDVDWGTAEDGDTYALWALGYLHQLTGSKAVAAVINRIMDAQIAHSGNTGQKLLFDVPFAAEESGSGLYNYYGNGATWAWDTINRPVDQAGLCLRITATLPAATGGYAGWGWWPNWPVTGQSPFNGLRLDFYGDGTMLPLQISTNIDPANLPAGDVSAGLPSLSAGWRSITIAPSDFWKTGNLAYDADRATSYSGVFFGGGGAASLSLYPENSVGPSGYFRYQTANFVYDVSSGGSAYAGCYFGVVGSAVGKDRFKFDATSNTAVFVDVTITDDLSVAHTTTISIVVGVATYTILFSNFAVPYNPAISDAAEITFQPQSSASGAVRMTALRFADATTDIVSMADSTVSVLNGFQFALTGYGTYDIYFDNVTIDQNQVLPYPLLPRWTYKWSYHILQNSTFYGGGAWRGMMAPGYMWIGGWHLAGRRYPGALGSGTVVGSYDQVINPGKPSVDYSGRLLSDCMIQFMKDGQDAYIAQFPLETPGPIPKKFGCWSWETINNGGYVGGVQSANMLNQWFVEGSDDWYGYWYRAFLSVAGYYYYTADATAKTILDRVMSWVTAKYAYNPTTKVVTEPVTFNVNGSVANGASGNIYAHALMAQTMIYKYWVDGDATALLWHRRLLDDMHYNEKISTTGRIIGAFVTNPGQNYTFANCTLTDPTGNLTGVSAVATIAGGMITHITILPGGGYGYSGTGCTNPQVTITGDGTGATATVYLSDLVVGGYSTTHTGWEVGDIGNAFALLVNGMPGGIIKHPLSATANDIQDFQDIHALLIRNATNSRPSLLTANLYSIHEFTLSPWHWGTGIENPGTTNEDVTATHRDTHADGMTWTETISPMLMFATHWYKYSGDFTMANAIFNQIQEMAGIGKSFVSTLPIPARQMNLRGLPRLEGDRGVKFSGVIVEPEVIVETGIVIELSASGTTLPTPIDVRRFVLKSDFGNFEKVSTTPLLPARTLLLGALDTGVFILPVPYRRMHLIEETLESPVQSSVYPQRGFMLHDDGLEIKDTSNILKGKEVIVK